MDDEADDADEDDDDHINSNSNEVSLIQAFVNIYFLLF